MFLALTVLSLALQAPAPPTGPLTPAQTLAVRTPSDPQVSPDGTRVALVVTEPPDGDEQPRQIWMLTVGTGEVRQLTFVAGGNQAPRWSPDGRTLAFLSGRRGPDQIYLLPMDGGDAMRLTDHGSRVRSFAWSPDSRAIAFIATEPPTAEERRKREDKDDARVVDQDDPHARAWVVDVASHETRRLTGEPWAISRVLWTPDGASLVVQGTRRPASEEETDEIARVAVADGRVTPVAAPRGPFGGVVVSPDGKTLAWIGARVDGPIGHDVYAQALDGPQARNLTAATLDRPVGGIEWTAGGRLLGIVQDGFTSRLSTVALDGRVEDLPAVPVQPSAFSSAAGVLAFTGETATEAPELWLAAGGATAARVTHFNDAWARPPAVAPERFTYRSADGTAIEAALLVPPGRAAGARLPLVVLVHGGPTGRWSDRFEPWGQLLVSRGYAVLYPNIRGSTGYGFDFLASNRADWGGGDFTDVMAGVDAVIARGVADPDRLGIGGWSYGGYMSEWAITQTDRFKAAVVGAGLSDLASEFGTEAGPSYDEWFYGLPYERLDGFTRSSPVTFIKNAKTPTLILQGTDDTTDPQGQSDQLYRPLKRYGVEVTYVLYPREGHGLREEKHLLDRLDRIIRWYDAHLR
ncbi:MAG: prolyl oligopeptidase family serine peptidase [Vicinamibacterales bacterium]